MWKKARASVSKPSPMVVRLLAQTAVCIIAIAVATTTSALTLTVDQAKISGLLLNTQNDPADEATIGTGSATVLAYANSVQTTNPNILSTSPNSAPPTATSYGRVTSGVNTIAVKSDTPLTGLPTLPGIFRVRFQLTGSGNPTFAAAPYNSLFQVLDIPSAGACKITTGPTATVTDGADLTVYEYTFTVSAGCSATGPNQGPNFLVLDAPWRLRNVGNASISVTLDQDVSSSGIYTTLATTSQLLASAVSPFELSLSADPAPISPGVPGTKRPTVLAFGTPPYQALSTAETNDLVIGSFKAGLTPLSSSYAGVVGTGNVPAIFTGLGYSNLSAIDGNQLTKELTVTSATGTFSTLAPSVPGFTASATTPSTITFTGSAMIATPTNITLIQASTGSDTLPSSYTRLSYTASLALKLDPSLGLTDPPPVSGVNLEPVAYEGLVFVAPWFGGALSANPGQVRIVNNHQTVGTGPIYIALRASTPSIVPTNGCQVSAGLAPGSEYVFGADQATICFGSFRRGDLFVAVQASAGSVIVKNRVLSQGNYAAESVIAPNNYGSGITNLPWFGGSKASTPSVVRVSNTNSIPTGAVTLTLSNIVDGSGPQTLTCNSSALSTLGSILAQGELVIGAAEANTCFGAFRRGDLKLEVAGNTTGLSPRMRVISGAGAAVAEQLVGNLSPDQTTNATNGNTVSLVAGWFGGSLASTSSVLRLSNSATIPTGPIVLTLTNINGSTQTGPLTCDANALSALSNLLPNAELVIDTPVIKTCFGDFRRGDLNILVTGPASGLSAKMRVINTSSGIVTEQALGPRCTDVQQDSIATCIIAPWFDGPTSVSKSVLRITNAATTATGLVEISLRNAVDSALGSNQVCASDKLNSLASIPSKGELVFDSVAAKTCFGNFRRGDLYVTVAGVNYSLYPAMRLISGGGGMVAEQSLGLTTTGAAPTQ